MSVVCSVIRGQTSKEADGPESGMGEDMTFLTLPANI
jgi:hypothetical protein